MKLTTFMTTAATAINLSSAISATEPQPTIPSPVPANTVYYYFKTKVQPGQPPKFNNHYLETYHTGAGFADPIFTPNAPENPQQYGWFNGTMLNWFKPPTTDRQIVMGLQYNHSAFLGSSSWHNCFINSGQGNPGLGLDAENKLVFVGQYKNEWISWLVCDWWHSYPQLFVLKSYPPKAIIPSSCAKVDLVAEVIPPEVRNSA